MNGHRATNTPPIVSPEEWEAARQQLLAKEKELTRARDALAAERRRMPWLAVEKKYEFDGPEGKASLLDLFGDRRQLIVYRAFFEPGVSGWPDHACIGCSVVADQVAHLLSATPGVLRVRQYVGNVNRSGLHRGSSSDAASIYCGWRSRRSFTTRPRWMAPADAAASGTGTRR